MTDKANASAIKADFTEVVANIVAAFVSSNALPVAELPALIALVHSALSTLHDAPTSPAVVATPRAVPAVPIKKSVTDDFIFCLEDGKKFKSLRRHLTSTYGMTPDQYRAKWDLPPDYPMVAPVYAAKRSQLAKDIGLGTRRLATKYVGKSAAKAPRGRSKKGFS